MRFWTAAAALTVLLGASGLCLAQGDTPSGDSTPVLTVETDQLMLGNVTAGEDAVGTFTFHNHGDRPVKIIRAKPS